MRRHRTPWQPGDGAMAALAVGLLVIVFILGYALIVKALDFFIGS
jgi:hypothetical protein